jgi:hypothetical protein
VPLDDRPGPGRIITKNGVITMETSLQSRDRRWRIVRWSAVAILLLLPLVAMQFSDDVVWTLSDFVLAGVLLGGIAGIYELIARRSGRIPYRFAVGVALLTSLLLVWVIGAVGLIGAEGDPFDLAYGGVLAVALLGATMAGLQSPGMARAMFATAAAQAVVVVIALVVGKQHVEASSVGEIVGSNGFFIVLWVWSALLFRLDAQQQAADGAGLRD